MKWLAFKINLIVFAFLVLIVSFFSFVSNRLNGARTPLGWCLEQIKKEDGIYLREEAYAYSYEDMHYVNEDLNYVPPRYKDAFHITFVYSYETETFHEEWMCFLDYDNWFWHFIREDEIYYIECELLTRTELR